MKKKVLLVMACILFITSCGLKKQPTIDMDLKGVLYTEDKYEVSKDVSATIVVTKYYDVQSSEETSSIKIYVQDKRLRKEVFLSFTENYLIHSLCDDAKCLKYLFTEIFNIEDEFIDESLVYFEQNNNKEETKAFAELSRIFDDYDGYLLFEFKDIKNCIQIDDLTYTLGNGNQDSVIIESRVYEVNVDLNK